MEEEHEQNKEESGHYNVEHPVHKKGGLKIKKSDIWKSATAILALLSIILIIVILNMRGGPSTTGVVVLSSDEVADKSLNYINNNLLQPGTTAKLLSISEKNNLYNMKLDIGGRPFDSYATKDGSLLFPSSVDMTEEIEIPEETSEPPAGIEKSDKPSVELFVFSYCPYSLQFQKAMLSVYELLKDKTDIDLVAIGAMHGEYEKTESLRQICMEKEYGKDKLWKYIKEFAGNTDIGDCRGDEDCTNPLIEKILSDLKIDKNKINSCMGKDAEKIYQEQNSRARELGISGSPTFVVNDIKVQVSRNSEAIKEVICNAFIESPEECSQTLSNQAVTPWFGYSAGSDTDAQC